LNSNFEFLISNLKSEELAILRHLYKFPEVTEQAARQIAPNLICSYLFELAKRFNAFYATCPIITDHPELTAGRLLLTASCAQVLKNGLNLLGIEALEKM
jgi:arginyl-tRNA synthetase